MSTPRFRVTFEVEWSELPALIEATGEFCEPEVDVIQQANGPAKRERSRTPPSQTDAGRAVLGLVLGSGRSWRAGDFEAEFERLGYSKTSVSPILAQLAGEGVIQRISKGTYAERVGTGARLDDRAAA